MNEPVYVAPRRKSIPYCMMNFADIRCDNYYYVDKTHFIPQIEQANRFFFFISLLYYFGMLTISGTHQGRTRLTSVTN